MSLKTAAAVRHVHFEDLGSFEPALRAAGYTLSYHDVAADGIDRTALNEADLLIVLGGPIGAYEDRTYPFLEAELALVEARLAKGRPLLGICLGAQIIARAAGARVYPMGYKEIGWGPVTLSDAGRAGPLRHLEGITLLHWHGDTFDLPPDCTLLASTEVCANQAFARGNNLLALQFHPEVTDAGFEPWLVGHACELGGAGLDPVLLRNAAREASPALSAAAPKLLSEWLQKLV
ncbi:MAG TPA: glutamine amidotransferase [Allosphingosinicella sp.]|nr:glutamine amidotransferase [Allosphingosinicella sp.]